jgi:sec-independent protein translocase protein TatA
MLGIGMPELLVIMVIALVIFGPKKIPEMGSAVGKALKDFKRSMSADDEDREGKEPPASQEGKSN